MQLAAGTESKSWEGAPKTAAYPDTGRISQEIIFWQRAFRRADRPSPGSVLRLRAMSQRVFAIGLLLAAWGGLASVSAQLLPIKTVPPAGPAVEVSQEPHHHFLFQNELVRAYLVEIAPRDSTQLHHHATDYIAISLGHSDVESITAKGASQQMISQDGDTRAFQAGVTHVVRNLAEKPFFTADIEVLQNTTANACLGDCAAKDARAKLWPALPPNFEILGYGDGFRVAEATLAPNESTTMRADPNPYLLVALTPLKMSAQPTGDGVQMTEDARDIVWIEAGPSHPLRNVSKEEARFVVIEFQKAKP